MALELTAVKIAELAFGGIIQGAVGKITEMGVGKVVTELQDKIRRKFQGNQDATKAIEAVEQGSETDLQKIAKYLNAFMILDEEFAQEVRMLAQQINVSNHEEKIIMNQENRDNAKGFQVKANEVQHIGDVNNPG